MSWDGPVDMVNQFRFHPTARYAAGSSEPNRSGREAFAIYAGLLAPVVKACGGSIRVWHGQVHIEITGHDEPQWDEILVVRYPSRKQLIKLLSSPEFAHIHHHRAAAIADSRTFICTAAQ